MQTTLGRMPEAARDVAARLRLAAAAAGDAATELLPGSGPTSPRWEGEAAEAHLAVRQGLRARANSVEKAAADAAVVLGVYAARMEKLAGRERAALRELEEADREVQTLHAAGGEVASAWERSRGAGARRDEVILSAEQAASVAAAGLARVREAIPDRPLSLSDHAADVAARAWKDGVIDPALGVWALTGDAFVKPKRWWETVTSLPGDTWDQLRHPLDTGKEVVAWEDWHDGAYGAAVGAMIVAASGHAFMPKRDNGAIKFHRNIADPDAPMPVLQTLAEMFQGVNLAQHEHHDLGHALRRHVNVGNRYLGDRLENGTLKDDGTRDPRPPKAASAWNDIETANQTVTRVLLANQARVLAFAGNTKQKLELQMPMGLELGRVMTPPGGRNHLAPGHSVVVVLRRTSTGEVYIHTAYVAP